MPHEPRAGSGGTWEQAVLPCALLYNAAYPKHYTEPMHDVQYPENPSAQSFWLVKEQESAPISVGHSGLWASGSPARLPVVNATHDFFNIIGLNLIDHAFYTPLILV